MKVVTVNTSDTHGGAARAANRLHVSLLQQNVDSTMVVQNKKSNDAHVSGPNSDYGKALALFRPHIDALSKKPYRHRLKTPYSATWIPAPSLIKKINKLDPDIVHLHWVCGGLLRLEQLTKIKAPIVWSLHDMWAFTGGCHYNNEGCSKYTEKCGQCPVLRTKSKNDLSRKVWSRKLKTYSEIENLTIVGVSRWLAGEAKQSSLLAGRNIVILPNPIDTTLFRPINRQTARSLWNIPGQAPVIAFGAMSAASDSNKGYNLLIKALKLIGRSDIHLIVFGSSDAGSSFEDEIPYSIHYAGRLHDDISLVTLYNAADVMVVPSMIEAFGQTASEAMSCGTPAVAFRTSGLIDIIDHKKNGYLAEPYSAEDLAAGIEWVLGDTARLERLSQNAREKVVREFDYSVVAPKYIELYESILKGKRIDS